MQIPDFLTKPPPWARNLGFWATLSMSVVNLGMLVYAKTVPGTQAFQKACILQAFLAAAAATAFYLVDRDLSRKTPPKPR